MKKRMIVFLAVAGALAVATAAIGLVAGQRSVLRRPQGTAPLVLKKMDLDRIKPGRNAEAAIGANERRGPDSTPDIESYLQRAYPADEVPIEATIGAQNAWAALNARAHSSGAWQLIGPSKATQPGVLDALGDFAQYVTAGRVTAMAIGPTCVSGACPVYVAAAGGGIWRTRNGLAGHPNWQFVSGSFATNAIGTLVVDPNDPSGRTLYAGTGEPNASADSEAGMGIYRSADGGATWSLLPGSSLFQGRSLASLVIAPSGDILVGVTRGVRGISSVLSGGATTTPPVAAALGLYRSTDGGASFSLIWGGNGSIRGVNEVALDPNNASILYAAAFQQGVWRSTNNGASFAQIKTPLNPALNTDRAEFALAALPGSLTRMYVGVGNQSDSGANRARVYRTDDAAGAAVFTDLTSPQNIGYCTSQCWYDNVVFSPAGHPDIVYLGGSFSYGQLGGVSNGRGVLLSTDAGATWSDLTQDGDPNFADATHPDQHGIVVNPDNPFQYWEGSDGGVVRSDGLFADVSYKCNTRGLNAAGLALCKSLLSRVPNQLYSLNEGFSTLQFQSLSSSARRPQNNLQGGTQDNGTWQYTGSSVVWPQVIYGDGGQSGFSSANDALRFNTFTGQANDVNFRNGDPTKWCIASGPIINSPESSYFYPPVTADPNPANGGTIFQGSFSVWRTQDWGGSRAFLE
ncbi:MAG: WD40/YVTN/BNR-like repeat-containing protein, partial [Acidithiobacillales bacterium]